MEVDFTTAGETTDYRRGFIDCLDLMEDIFSSVKQLEELKSYMLTIRASIQEKNVVRIREDLNL